MKTRLDDAAEEDQARQAGKAGAPQHMRTFGPPLMQALPLEGLDIRFVSKRWLAQNPSWRRPGLLVLPPTEAEIATMSPQQRHDARQVNAQWAAHEDSPEPEGLPSGSSTLAGGTTAATGLEEETEEETDSSGEEGGQGSKKASLKKAEESEGSEESEEESDEDE